MVVVRPTVRLAVYCVMRHDGLQTESVKFVIDSLDLAKKWTVYVIIRLRFGHVKHSRGCTQLVVRSCRLHRVPCARTL